MPEIQAVITQNKQIIKSVSKEMNMQGSLTVKSLEEFRQLVNATITALIEESDGNQDDTQDVSEESSEDEEDSIIPVTPKKRRQ